MTERWKIADATGRVIEMMDDDRGRGKNGEDRLHSWKLEGNRMVPVSRNSRLYASTRFLLAEFD